MAESIFLMCALVSAMCAFALLRGYRRSRNSLLLWSGACFVILALSNAFLVMDVIVFPTVNFQGPLWRNFMSAVAGSVLLTGLIMELS